MPPCPANEVRSEMGNRVTAASLFVVCLLIRLPYPFNFYSNSKNGHVTVVIRAIVGGIRELVASSSLKNIGRNFWNSKILTYFVAIYYNIGEMNIEIWEQLFAYKILYV